jgi:hypothetical protein
MMTKNIRSRMYKNIAFLVFLLLIAITVTFTNKTRTVEPTSKPHDQVETKPGVTGPVLTSSKVINN